MYISVTVLYEAGKRLSPYAIRVQVPYRGWLMYEIHDYGGIQKQRVRARLVSEAGDDLVPWLDHAQMVACRGKSGALIEGVQYRRKGTKHSVGDQQAWWCEAPPREGPLLSRQAIVLAAEREYAARKIAGWGDV